MFLQLVKCLPGRQTEPCLLSSSRLKHSPVGDQGMARLFLLSALARHCSYEGLVREAAITVNGNMYDLPAVVSEDTVNYNYAVLGSGRET